MSRILFAALSLLGSVCLSPNVLAAQSKRPATALDCLNVRRLQPSATAWLPIQFDPQGHYVAYGVGRADLEKNQNVVDLYVKRIDSNISAAPRFLFSAPDISQLHWLSDGRHLLALAKKNGRSVIESIDVESTTHSVLVAARGDIREFSVDRLGQVIAFDVGEAAISPADKHTEDEIAQGYRIPFEAPQNTIVGKRLVLVTRRTGRDSWSHPKRLSIEGPIDHAKLDMFQGIDNHGDLNLSLAPDGKRLIFAYRSEAGVPQAWKQSPLVKQILTAGSAVDLAILVDLDRNTASLAIQSPWTFWVPFWSGDSRYFAVMSLSPIGSVWEREETAKHANFVQSMHTFVVDARSLQVSLAKLPSVDDPTLDEPLAWEPDNTLWLHIGRDEIARLARKGGEWVSGNPVKIPFRGDHGFPVLSTNGHIVVGSYEAPTVAPELYVYDLGTRSLSTIAKLNPQFDDIQLANVERISWEAGKDYRINGVLIKPPNFEPGKRYPLVIQAEPGESDFVCDAGLSNFPSEIPLPLADAGILYLYRVVPFGYRAGEDRVHFPSGYPGGLGEAALEAEIWDGAVDQLSRDGMIDPTRIGITGYSRTGWYTEFALAHGRTKYRAASVTDNIQYSLGEYWISRRPFAMRSFDEMYGGSPYGDSLQSWLRYSISFNLGKIHTPLLLEQMGYGAPSLGSGTISLNLAPVFETFSGLNALNRPVELYYYPNETHTMDHPKARWENLQRNVDWFRFWLQGYERPHPEDADQYLRWRKFETEFAAPSQK